MTCKIAKAYIPQFRHARVAEDHLGNIVMVIVRQETLLAQGVVRLSKPRRVQDKRTNTLTQANAECWVSSCSLVDSMLVPTRTNALTRSNAERWHLLHMKMKNMEAIKTGNTRIASLG